MTEGAATATVRRQRRRPWWERVRERGRGKMDVSWGSGRRRGASLGVHGCGRQAGGAVASSHMPTSPPSLPGGEEAAGWHGPAQCWAARWAGWWVRPGKLVSLLFLFFFSFCRFVAFLKIPRHFQKSPNCACPMFRIYQTWNILVWDYLDILYFIVFSVPKFKYNKI